jgi:hypothetical protein
MAPSVSMAKRLAALTVTLLVAISASGCFEPKGTVKKEQPKAQSTAKSNFAADAEFVAAFGLEGKDWDDWDYTPWRNNESEVTKYFAKAAQDGRVGDGKTELWAYGFLSETKKGSMYVVFVDKNGDVMGDAIFPFQEKIYAIGKYKVNSDEAVKIAKGADSNLSKGLAMENSVLFMALVHPIFQLDQFWLIAGGGGDGDNHVGGFAVVDAITGKVFMTSQKNFMGGENPFGF